MKAGSRLLPALLLCFYGTAAAEPEFDIGGLLFGDLYHVPSHHLEEGDGATGAVIRRGYLTFNAKFNENWFGRLRFELNQSGEFETYDFEVDYKDLYVGRNIGEHRLTLGLQPTLTFDVIESVWGMRYLMRTPMDLQGVASRDTGVSFKGPFGQSESWSYRVMAAGEWDFGTETDDTSKLMIAVNWLPSPGWMLDFYVDYEDFEDKTDRTTLQGFAGYQDDKTDFGIMYAHQDRETDPPLELASVFATHVIGQKTSLVGRIDRIIEPSPRGNNIAYIPFDPSAPATMFLAGLEYRFNDHWALIPNTIVINYDRNDEGVRPETDVHLRLTLFIDFE